MTEAATRRRSSLLWIGPLLSGVGLLSYFAIFARWPSFRDHPWANVILIGLGVWASIAGLRRVWPGGGWRRIAGATGVVFSTALGALLLVYCYVLSYQLPDTDGVLAVGHAIPDLVLLDQSGREVELARPGNTILVFYRGHW